MGRLDDRPPTRSHAHWAAATFLNATAATATLTLHPYGPPAAAVDVVSAFAGAAAAFGIASLPLLAAERFPRWARLLAATLPAVLLTAVGAAVVVYASLRRPLFAEESLDAIRGAAPFFWQTVSARAAVAVALWLAGVAVVQAAAAVAAARLPRRSATGLAVAVVLVPAATFFTPAAQPGRTVAILGRGVAERPAASDGEFQLQAQFLAARRSLPAVRDAYESVSLASRPPRRPDVLIVLIETLRADALTAEVMPNLWAASRDGLTARRHYATGNTSDYAFFGLSYGLDATHYPVALSWRPAMPALFAEAGYAVAFLGMGDFARFGWDGRSPPPGYDIFRPNHDAFYPDRDRATVRDADDLLARRGDFEALRGRPVLAIVSLYTPHYAYPSDPDARPFRPAFEAEPSWPPAPAERDKLWNRYRNSVHTLDRLAAPLFGRDECLTVVVGDHGETFFDDGRLLHGTALSHVQLATPCVIRGPGVSAGQTSEVTTHADILPTLLDLLGAGVNDPTALSGQSVRDLRAGRPIALGNLAGDTTGVLRPDAADVFADQWQLRLRDGHLRPIAPCDRSGDRVDGRLRLDPLRTLLGRTLRTELPDEDPVDLLRTVLRGGDEATRLTAVRLLAERRPLAFRLAPELRQLARTAETGVVRDAARKALDGP